MQVEHTTEKGRVLFVKVPDDAIHFEIAIIKGLHYLIYGDVSFDYRLKEVIPSHNWQLIGLTSEINEEQANMMGFDYVYDGRDDENIKGLIYECFDDSDFTCYNALDSLKSLMQHLQVYEVNPFGYPTETEYEGKEWRDEVIESDKQAWQEAQQTTGAWLVLFKPND